MRRKPCDFCSNCVDDFRQCAPYHDWFCNAWLRYQQYVPRDYWDHRRNPEEKLKYVHPDVLRRYLRDGPCPRCNCRVGCDVPCAQYRCWWDARMVWLKWNIENNTPPVPEGYFYDTNSASFAMKSLFRGQWDVSEKYVFQTASSRFS